MWRRLLQKLVTAMVVVAYWPWLVTARASAALTAPAAARAIATDKRVKGHSVDARYRNTPATCSHAKDMKNMTKTHGGSWGSSRECFYCGQRWLKVPFTNRWEETEAKPTPASPTPKMPDRFRLDKMKNQQAYQQGRAEAPRAPSPPRTGGGASSSSREPSAASPVPVVTDLQRQELRNLEQLRRMTAAASANPAGLFALGTEDMQRLGQILGVPSEPPAVFPDAAAAAKDEDEFTMVATEEPQ